MAAREARARTVRTADHVSVALAITFESCILVHSVNAAVADINTTTLVVYR